MQQIPPREASSPVRPTSLVEPRLSGTDWKTSRRMMQWPGLTVETVTSVGREPFSFGFAGACGLLSLGEKGYRHDGETIVDGAPPSRRRDLGGRMVFVPPGAKLSGWSVPGVRSTWLNIYIGPVVRSLEGDFRLDALGLEPRIHFTDPSVRATLDKLKTLLEDIEESSLDYAQMLCALAIAELQRSGTRRDRSGAKPATVGPGGRSLDGARFRRLRDYIEERLEQPLPLAELAGLAGVSPLHLIRSFRKATGVSPHRYIVLRRIERAKILLARPANSVTDVALATGFGSSSHFCQSFRSVVGVSPTAFRGSAPRQH